MRSWPGSKRTAVPAGDVQAKAARRVAVEDERGVGLVEVVVRADLDRPVAGVGDLDRHRGAARVELDVAVGDEELARRHGYTIGLWTVTSFVPSGNVASTCTSGDHLGDAVHDVAAREHRRAVAHQLGDGLAVARAFEDRGARSARRSRGSSASRRAPCARSRPARRRIPAACPFRAASVPSFGLSGSPDSGCARCAPKDVGSKLAPQRFEKVAQRLGLPREAADDEQLAEQRCAAAQIVAVGRSGDGVAAPKRVRTRTGEGRLPGTRKERRTPRKTRRPQSARAADRRPKSAATRTAAARRRARSACAARACPSRNGRPTAGGRATVAPSR